MMAVIPSAGYGKRMFPLTKKYPKCALPVLNKPLIVHTIELLQDLKIKKIVVVIGYLGNAIKNKLKQLKTCPNVKFVSQKDINGDLSAIKIAKDKTSFKGNLLVIWGDNYFKGVLNNLVHLHHNNNFTISLILEKSKSIHAKPKFVVNNNKVIKIFKNSNKLKTLKNFKIGIPCGVYILNTDVLSLYDYAFDSTCNEYKLDLLLELLLNKGEKVGFTWIKGWRINITCPKDLLLANILTLNEIGKSFHYTSNSEIKGSKLRRVIIGSDCKIYNSKITNSVIFGNVKIFNCRISNSIITDDVCLKYRNLVNSVAMADFDEGSCYRMCRFYRIQPS